MEPEQQDASVRKAAFDWLETQQRHHGDVLPRGVLAQGFLWRDQRVPLVSAQGIFKPRVLPEIPLTITTSPNGPYADSFADDHRLTYRYRGTDPGHRDNVGLREAMWRRTPLIYLFGLIPGRYLPIWPVFIVGDNPDGLIFVRRDILDEQDGPVLQYGLKGLHQIELYAPPRRGDRPDPERLARRFEEFLEAQESRGRPGPG